MADMEPGKISAENKLKEELGVVARFLDVDLKARTAARPAGRRALWPWRRTIAFVFVTGLLGWSLVAGAIYLLVRLWS